MLVFIFCCSLLSGLYFCSLDSFSFFHVSTTSEIYTLSLHDALPISRPLRPTRGGTAVALPARCGGRRRPARSEEHTSELQSLRHLVCRLLLEKKKNPDTLYRDHWALGHCHAQRITGHRDRDRCGTDH